MYLQWHLFQGGLKPGGLFILKENIARSGKNFIYLLDLLRKLETIYPIEEMSQCNTDEVAGLVLPLGFVLDKQDKSITRSDLYFKQLFKQCGLHIYKMKVTSELLTAKFSSYSNINAAFSDFTSVHARSVSGSNRIPT